MHRGAIFSVMHNGEVLVVDQAHAQASATQSGKVRVLEHSTGSAPGRGRLRRSRHRRPRDSRPANRCDDFRMTPMSDDLRRVRFAHFVDRALAAARYRGLTDKDIETATGVRSSTFHRWKRGEVRTIPGLGTILRFCEGIGVDPKDAMTALGITGERDNPQPEPQMDPDLRLILRRLADPNTPETEKEFIRESLRMLAERADRRRRETG